jgi:hypothetical protein
MQQIQKFIIVASQPGTTSVAERCDHTARPAGAIIAPSDEFTEAVRW